jgi:hypothetical protein
MWMNIPLANATLKRFSALNGCCYCVIPRKAVVRYAVPGRS